jgi:copper chaperone NosL
MTKLTPLSRWLILLSSLLLIILFFTPIWQIDLWAPQYPEWLSMQIWLYQVSGDINTINGLNHYIGMKHIQTEMFPEFKIMPYIAGGMIITGLLLALWGKRLSVWIWLLILVGAAVAGFVDFYLWSYDYGHNLDPKAAIIVPGMVYQPPLLGSKELLNFMAYAGPAIGGWIAFASGILAIVAVLSELFKKTLQRKFSSKSGLLR